jgi:cysteine desulfurase
MIYMDNAASTRVDERVMHEMAPYFSDRFGNPSSLHSCGAEAKEALESARARIASLVGADQEGVDVVFTSGGTESNNLALKGIAYANRSKGKHIIVSSIEHDCIINSSKWLESQGFEVTYLPVSGEGLVSPEVLESAIRRDTVLVSIMHANNEIGTLEPLAEFGKICREKGVYFHTDACQSFGKVPASMKNEMLSAMTINSHKIYGPKGVGALVLRSGTKIEPWQHGGGHESGLRSSTENVPGIVGFAKAAQLCHAEMAGEQARETALRERIFDRLNGSIPVSYVNGHRTKRLPNNVNVGFHGLEGEAVRLLLELDRAGICVSTGSACSSNQPASTPSHVLTAIGLNPVEARGSLRITLGRYNTAQEVDYLMESLERIVNSLKPISQSAK